MVTRELASDVISKLVGKRKTRQPLTAHVSQLKLWRGRDEYPTRINYADDSENASENESENE